MATPLILLVDPDPDTRAILRTYLEHRHYRVVDSADGEQALALAKRHDPDVVIGELPMDVPGHSPFSEALRNYARSNAAILIYTSRTLPEDVELASAVGDAVVFKPASPSEVLVVVEHLMDRRRKASAPR